ncbi:type II CAAX prenyl endopeptidase Rce1 family protein, partial [Lysinibacillus sp. D4B2_S17]|uniref:CPBP family glutamic-type intramembrane protease n=1 Tax=Lysinibacillus sp. D4B2_S17 TaxID=2941225 RepID=UPI0020BEBBD7
HMGEWPVFYQGYYDPAFPLPLLLIGLIGTFIGEEIYFRGYLLRKVGLLKFDWLWIAINFQLYHM